MTIAASPRAQLVCLVPNPSIDKTAVVERLVEGEIHRPTEIVPVAGGKGLNVARAARTLGVPVEAVLLLAGHAGRWIDDELTRRRLTHHVAWAPGETRTCLSVLDRSTGQMTEVYEPGPPISAAAWRQFMALTRHALRSTPPGSIAALSGSLPPGAPPEAAGEIVRMAAAARIRVIVDTSGPALAAGLAAGPSLVKVNAAEAAGAIGWRTPDSEQATLAVARALLDRGAGAAVVTRGAAGAVAAEGGRGWAVDGRPGGPFTVGAGDAFLAGLAAGLLRNEPLPRALARAAAAAAASTLVAGPGNLDRRVAGDLVAEARVRDLA